MLDDIWFSDGETKAQSGKVASRSHRADEYQKVDPSWPDFNYEEEFTHDRLGFSSANTHALPPFSVGRTYVPTPLV